MQERQGEVTEEHDWAGEANPQVHHLQEEQASWRHCKHLKIASATKVADHAFLFF